MNLPKVQHVGAAQAGHPELGQRASRADALSFVANCILLVYHICEERAKFFLQLIFVSLTSKKTEVFHGPRQFSVRPARC